MNLSGNTNNNCLRLLNYLQQILKKKELEESLLLSENDNNFIVIPKSRIISWQKKIKLDYSGIRKELKLLEDNLSPLTFEEQKQIVRDLVNEMLEQKNNDLIEKTFVLYLCYEFTELIAEYEHILSQSYDTRDIDPLYQPPSFMTGYYFYTTNVKNTYNLEEIKILSDTLIKRHRKLKTEIQKYLISTDWYVKNLLDCEFHGFSKLKIQSANFDFRVNHEITTSKKLLNSLSYFIPAYLEELLKDS